MNLLEQIENSLSTMSKGHKLLANYILNNYDKASYMTALKLSKAIGISESTVVRFAYHLGFEGYPGFQKALKESVQSNLTSIQRLTMHQDEMDNSNVLDVVLKSDMKTIKTTLENMDKNVFNKAVDTLICAGKIYVIGLRSSSFLADFLVHYLSYLLPDNVCVMSSHADPFEYLVRLTKDDCVVGISFPRYSNTTKEAMAYAKELGAKTIAITDNSISPLVKVATYPLFALSNTNSIADSLVAPLSVINAIVAAVSMKRGKQALDYFEKLEEVWGSRKIYSQKGEE